MEAKYVLEYLYSGLWSTPSTMFPRLKAYICCIVVACSYMAKVVLVVVADVVQVPVVEAVVIAVLLPRSSPSNDSKSLVHHDALRNNMITH